MLDPMVAAAGAVPVLKIQNAERRSRLTTLFRLIIAIPWYIVAGVWGIVALLCAIVAWFALLFTGRYPAGLYEFIAGYARFATRAFAFTWLVVDPLPPFDGAEHPEYPAELQLGPPLASYNRLKVLLRIIYIIPAYIVTAVAGIIFYIVGFISWLAIMITGKQPDGLQNALCWALGWQTRYVLLITLTTETYELELA
jgi:hypothetical protein